MWVFVALAVFTVALLALVALAAFKRDTFEYLSDLIGTRATKYGFWTVLLTVAILAGALVWRTLYVWDMVYYSKLSLDGKFVLEYMSIGFVARTVAIIGLTFATRYYVKKSWLQANTWLALWCMSLFICAFAAAGFLSEGQDSAYRAAKADQAIVATASVNVSSVIDDATIAIAGFETSRATQSSILDSMVAASSGAMEGVTGDGLDNDDAAVELSRDMLTAQSAANTEMARLDGLIAGENAKIAAARQVARDAAAAKISNEASAPAVSANFVWVSRWLGGAISPVNLRDFWTFVTLVFMETYAGVILSLVWFGIAHGAAESEEEKNKRIYTEEHARKVKEGREKAAAEREAQHAADLAAQPKPVEAFGYYTEKIAEALDRATRLGWPPEGIADTVFKRNLFELGNDLRLMVARGMLDQVDYETIMQTEYVRETHTVEAVEETETEGAEENDSDSDAAGA